MLLNNKIIYQTYKKEIFNIPGLEILEFNEEYKTSYLGILVKLTNEWPFTLDFTIGALSAENILSRTYHYPASYQQHTQCSDYSEKLPITEKLSKQFIMMPSGYMLMPKDIRVIAEFLDFLWVNSDEILARVGGFSRES